MPTYIIKYSNFKISNKQKKKIAKDVTMIHSKVTGANTFFAQVIFEQNKRNSHFMGGKLVKTKEIFLNGQIRGGRSSKIKKKLILGLKRSIIKNSKVDEDKVWVYIEDLFPNQMIEYGKILPKSGKEKKWIKSLSINLKKRLQKLEKYK
tara:strand:+ start:159 stop:605 length:447 start_codon:yes stop_codon:yes gene_type:complete